MIIKHIQTLEIVPTSPFHFDATFHKPDHFTSCDNYWEPGTRWQTMHWKGKDVGLKIENKGIVTRPKIKINIYYNKAVDPDFIKSLVNKGTDIDLNTACSLEISYFSSGFSTQDQKEGMKAFLEKRKPIFKGK